MKVTSALFGLLLAEHALFSQNHMVSGTSRPAKFVAAQHRRLLQQNEGDCTEQTGVELTGDDINMPGIYYGRLDGLTLDECKIVCLDHKAFPYCSHAFFVPDGLNEPRGACFPKAIDPIFSTAVPTPHVLNYSVWLTCDLRGGRTCASSYTWFAETNVQGYDLPASDNGSYQPDADGCARHCAITPACDAFVWRSRSGHCWRKNLDYFTFLETQYGDGGAMVGLFPEPCMGAVEDGSETCRSVDLSPAEGADGQSTKACTSVNAPLTPQQYEALLPWTQKYLYTDSVNAFIENCKLFGYLDYKLKKTTYKYCYSDWERLLQVLGCDECRLQAHFLLTEAQAMCASRTTEATCIAASTSLTVGASICDFLYRSPIDQDFRTCPSLDDRSTLWNLPTSHGKRSGSSACDWLSLEQGCRPSSVFFLEQGAFQPRGNAGNASYPLRPETGLDFYYNQFLQCARRSDTVEGCKDGFTTPPYVPGTDCFEKVTWEVDADVIGGELPVPENGSKQRTKEACSHRCAVTSDCNAVAYTTATRRCWLKNVQDDSELDDIPGRTFGRVEASCVGGEGRFWSTAFIQGCGTQSFDRSTGPCNTFEFVHFYDFTSRQVCYDAVAAQGYSAGYLATNKHRAGAGCYGCKVLPEVGFEMTVRPDLNSAGEIFEAFNVCGNAGVPTTAGEYDLQPDSGGGSQAPKAASSSVPDAAIGVGIGVGVLVTTLAAALLLWRWRGSRAGPARPPADRDRPALPNALRMLTMYMTTRTLTSHSGSSVQAPVHRESTIDSPDSDLAHESEIVIDDGEQGSRVMPMNSRQGTASTHTGMSDFSDDAGTELAREGSNSDSDCVKGADFVLSCSAHTSQPSHQAFDTLDTASDLTYGVRLPPDFRR